MAQALTFPEMLREAAGNAVFDAAVQREAMWNKEREALEAVIESLQLGHKATQTLPPRPACPQPSACLPLLDNLIPRPVEPQGASRTIVRVQEPSEVAHSEHRPASGGLLFGHSPRQPVPGDIPAIPQLQLQFAEAQRPGQLLLPESMEGTDSKMIGLRSIPLSNPRTSARPVGVEIRAAVLEVLQNAKPFTHVHAMNWYAASTSRLHNVWVEKKKENHDYRMLRPDSRKRMFFDLLTIIALVHDGTVIPFVLAWDLEVNTLLRILFICSLLVWSMDMVMNFCTGYYRPDGEVEMRWRMVSKHYIKTHFIFDAFITLSDWLINVLEAVEVSTNAQWSRTARLGRVARIGRVMRLVDLARIFRLYSRILTFGSATLSNTWSIILQAFKILTMIVWFNHLSSCVFFALGRGVKEGVLKADTGRTWLDIYVDEMAGIQYSDTKVSFQYTTSMHWSMTQMTPGSMAVVPRNSWERTWNIICLILGLCFGTSLVGQLSSKMVQFNMSRQVEIKRMDMLRRYLRENKIDSHLASRVQKQIAERRAVKTRLGEQDVEDLQHLSNNLRSELRHETYMPHVIKHPLFSAWGLFDVNVAKSLSASGGITFECMSPGHDLFTPESIADCAYLHLRGRLRYKVAQMTEVQQGRRLSSDSVDQQSHGTSSFTASQTTHAIGKYSTMSAATYLSRAPSAQPESTGTPEPVTHVWNVEEVGNWFCEVALWMYWLHKGTLEAVTKCEFVSVSAHELVKQLQQHPKICEITLQWCKAFQEVANEVDEDSFAALPINLEHGAIIVRMPEEHRMAIGSCTLTLMEGKEMRLFGKRKGYADLEEEVRLGKCVLCIDGRGDFVRTVPVVALKISRPLDGKILLQLGKYRVESGSWESTCDFPGGKIQIGEDAVSIARNILDQDLAHVAEYITLGEAVSASEQKKSASFGVRSRYLKTIFACTMEVPDSIPLSVTESDVIDVDPETFDGDGALGRLEPQVVRDHKRKWLLYGWFSPIQLEMMREGLMPELEEEIERWSFRPKPVLAKRGRLSESGLMSIGIGNLVKASGLSPLVSRSKSMVVTKDPDAPDERKRSASLHGGRHLSWAHMRPASPPSEEDWTAQDRTRSLPDHLHQPEPLPPRSPPVVRVREPDEASDSPSASASISDAHPGQVEINLEEVPTKKPSGSVVFFV